MPRVTVIRAITLLLLAGVARAEVDFEREIAPLLASRCLSCHSGAEPKGGLDLTQEKRVRQGGESGEPALGKTLDDSPLWKLVASGEMPPKAPLPQGERELLKAWISSGATWGAGPIDPLRYTTASRAGYNWWSLLPVRPQPPPTTGTGAANEPLDAFLLARLDAAQVKPTPEAEPRAWFRRLKFDLLGLPPEPAETAAFLADRSPDAHERAIDRMLASPQYGERWARHWLDVAHFGESDGFEYDRMRPSAWRYRDWLIGAFNRDLPYDQFAQRQIAGDLLAGATPLEAEDGVIATGFLVAGAHDSLIPKGEIMRAIMRQDELEDLVGVVSQSFLGLTVQCARCHDHKFDPISQRDYYHLAAALGGVKRGERSLPHAPASQDNEARLAAVLSELRQLDAAARKAVLAGRKSPASALAPKPLAAWEFEGDARDAVGDLHGELVGGAKIEQGALLLDGKSAFLRTPPLKAVLAEKTLEVWVRLDTLEQRGGGAISLQTLGGEVFDAVVFGERDPRQWLAGSNNFIRTQSFSGSPESEATQRFVQFAIVYTAEGRITAYRDGALYGKAYASGKLQTFEAGKAQVVLGLRHGAPGGNRMLSGKIDRARLYDRALTAEEIAASAGGAGFVADAELLAALSAEQRGRREQLLQERGQLEQMQKSKVDRKAFAVTPAQPAESFVLLRGDPQRKGEPAPPAGLSALAQLAGHFSLANTASDAERRRALAMWISSRENPLFARTLVNRVWHYRFGRGLIETPSDLGFNGGAPSHPELLEHLTHEFVRGGFSIKALHRRLLSSQAFRLSSQLLPAALAKDADNRLLWRYAPRRLDAESLRDAVLAVAGELNPQMGGESFQDFRPYFYKGSQFYEPQDYVGPTFQRRSVYRMWARGGRNPLLDTFDCPDPSASTPRRGGTTTPLQALSLLNSSLMLRMSDSLAQRLEREAASPAERVALAWQLCYGRSGDPEEAAAATAFAAEFGWPALARVLLNSNGFLYVD